MLLEIGALKVGTTVEKLDQEPGSGREPQTGISAIALSYHFVTIIQTHLVLTWDFALR